MYGPVSHSLASCGEFGSSAFRLQAGCNPSRRPVCLNTSDELIHELEAVSCGIYLPSGSFWQLQSARPGPALLRRGTGQPNGVQELDGRQACHCLEKHCPIIALEALFESAIGLARSTILPFCTSRYSWKCSAISPAFVGRKKWGRRLPAFPSILRHDQGVCTSPNPSRGSSLRPSGRQGAAGGRHRPAAGHIATLWQVTRSACGIRVIGRATHIGRRPR